MSYDVENMLLLLLTIKHTQSSNFVMQHLSYGSISELCSKAINEGFKILIHEEFHITEKGKIFIKHANDELKNKGIAREIARIPDVYIPKISDEDIYLPDKI